MAKRAQKTTETISPVEQLLNEAASNETTSKRLTEQQVIKMINDLWDEVTSKNAMLKLMRANGYSISMNRVFEIYNKMLVLKNKETKEEAPIEIK